MAKTDMVMIDLDRPRELRFGFKALKMIEGMFKKPLMEVDLGNLKSDTLEKILYAGLKADDKDLEFDKMEDLLDLIPYKEIVGKMGDAISKAYGIDPGEVEKAMETPEDNKKK
jgi:hypothetical protein